MLPLYDRLAALGMNVSKRVRLFWHCPQTWKSADGEWTLSVTGGTATIAVQVPLSDTFKMEQTWTCWDFDPPFGGQFHHNSIDPGDGGPLQPALLQLVLRVN